LAIRGLTLFAEHFSAYRGHYVMIGGVASWLTMEEAGASFRATKDLDIVLVIEALSSEFVAHFWHFITLGEYTIKQTGGDRPVLYRFQHPGNADYPSQIELFSRALEGLEHPEHHTLTALPTDDSVSSLSAILLDDTYYRFLLEGRQVSLGITHIEADRLIPFKARAWLDLTARKNAGEAVDSKSIRKHRNDVLQLSGLLTDEPVRLPRPIADDLNDFLHQLEREEVNFKDLGLRGSLAETIERLRLSFDT
jgi:hypothetical protein